MIAKSSAEPLDDPTVWAVTCFVVRREHRGLGLNKTLLDAAIDVARDSGARLIEGYPIDNGGTSVRSNDLYHGALSTFLRAGFVEAATMKPGRALVTLDLTT
ncbi:GNAT family N-acetyltransferase [Microbacterium sp. ZW T5_45]|uniref:GNAT family N-acetyltransferase n=1 Tax=Microbacterium sp. ZW T5_45 TaxID=3378080 RepID=UPI00385405F8